MSHGQSRENLRSLGVSALNISSQSVPDASKIDKGEYSLVSGSAEASLKNRAEQCDLLIEISLVFGQFNLIKNNKQTAMINIL